MAREVNFGKMLHGGDYNPEQWLHSPEILEKDIEYFKKAKINEVSLGIFSWAVLEPVEGEFHFEWMEKIIDRLYENGISTILATPTGARPRKAGNITAARIIRNVISCPGQNRSMKNVRNAAVTW